MKKILPVLLMSCCALLSNGKTVLNCDLRLDFQDGTGTQLSLPEGWSTTGVAATPSGPYAPLFTNYTPTNAFSVFDNGNATDAFTPSEFDGGIANDQWLISPEFTVAEDVMLITYTVDAIGNSINNNYSIYISESGNDRKEFYEIFGSSIKGEGNKTVSSTRTFVLDGYKGEKVNLAFISRGNKSGMMGFRDISVAPYYLALEDLNAIKSIILDNTHEDISFDVTLSTPVAAKGLEVVLTTSSGYESTFSYSHPIAPSKQTQVAVSFPKIEMNGTTSCTYKMVFKLDYPDAPSTEIEGVINYGERTYQGVAVIEELTGTWCGYCVYGVGIMNYLQDTYDGSGDGRALGFAVHCSSSSPDPMQVDDIKVPTTALATKLKYPGFPYMIINRSFGCHPLNALDFCKEVVDMKSYAKVEISNVDFNPATSAVKVDYNAYLSFSADNPSINALAYVTQNNMTGAGSKWKQLNYLYEYTDEDIVKEMGEALVPYFKPYINKDENKLTLEFPDVSRAIYPSFDGERIEGEWIAGSAKEGSFEFTMPATVTDWENSMISIILTNAGTGEIIAGDRMGAADYTKDFSAINSINQTDDIRVRALNGGDIEILAHANGIVEVYAVDGKKTLSTPIQEGTNIISVGDKYGMYIVRITAGNTAKSLKVTL